MNRFTDDNDGTIVDTKTNLIWLKNANRFGKQTWEKAAECCHSLDTEFLSGWRLPTVKELQSLVDYNHYCPSLPSNNPFIDVQLYTYWSNMPVTDNRFNVWYVSLRDGNFGTINKTYFLCVWPVRSYA